MKLTKTVVDAARYRGDGQSQDIRWDDLQPGFGLRLYPSGAKSFVTSYRVSGRKRIVFQGEFDAVLGMYHDQALGPLKLHAFGRAVNVTLGLPLIRTSVDHGTAFDIAGRGRADPGSMIEALRLAAKLVRGHA